ncbi:hypothetical protein EYR36_001217 [Pleurotus pulmonarius]|nr:hypothetical protein EYR36_001217 [Pleurotus pulmonarius]
MSTSSETTVVANNPADAGLTSDEPMVVWSITRAQRKYLAEKLPEYRMAFVNNMLTEFCTVLNNEWFRRWPSNDDAGRPFVEEQLRAWLLSNSRWLPSSAQKRFLKNTIPDYKASQESRTLGDFWAPLFAEWFSRWAATEIAPQGLVEKKLKAWFNNNARVTANACQVLNLNKPAKRTRRPAPYQTFCNVYWHTPIVEGATIAQIVKREWVIEWKNSEHYKEDIPRPPPPVTFVNSVAARIYASVSDSIKKEISEHPDQQRDQDRRDRDTTDEGDGSAQVTLAREMQRAIDSLPYSLDQAGKQILAKTGFVMFTMVAGPVPSQGGNIAVYSMVEGKTSTGCDFRQYCGQFDSEVEVKFAEFSRLVFPAAERIKRALPGTEYLRNYELPALPTTQAPQPSMVPQAPPPPTPLPAGLLQIDKPSSDSEDGASDREPTPVATTTRVYLSEYEKDRLANIARNKQLLEDLGLGDVRLTQQPKPTRARRKQKEANTSATRRSSRISREQDLSGSNVDKEAAPAVAIAAAPAVVSEAAPAIVSEAAPAVVSEAAPAIVSEAAPAVVSEAAPVVAAEAAAEAEGASVIVGSTSDPAIAMEVDEIPMPSLADAPAWLHDAVEHLKELGKDPISTHMLAAGKQRPKEVGAWVKSGRGVDPNIKNIKVFCQQWWLWYHELQLECRKAVGGCLQRVAPPNDEWTELRKGTINGMYSLLASLGWWMNAANGAKQCQDDVSLALSDVAWVLESMVRLGTSKSASPEAEERVSKRARAV